MKKCETCAWRISGPMKRKCWMIPYFGDWCKGAYYYPQAEVKK